MPVLLERVSGALKELALAAKGTGLEIVTPYNIGSVALCYELGDDGIPALRMPTLRGGRYAVRTGISTSSVLSAAAAMGVAPADMAIAEFGHAGFDRWAESARVGGPVFEQPVGLGEAILGLPPGFTPPAQCTNLIPRRLFRDWLFHRISTHWAVLFGDQESKTWVERRLYPPGTEDADGLEVILGPSGADLTLVSRQPLSDLMIGATLATGDELSREMVEKIRRFALVFVKPRTDGAGGIAIDGFGDPATSRREWEEFLSAAEARLFASREHWRKRASVVLGPR